MQDGAPHRVAPRSPSEAIKPVAAPPPPPRAKKPRGGFLAAFSGFLTLLIAIAAALVFGVTVIEREAHEKGPLQDDKVVMVPRNTGMSEIAALLKREGVQVHRALRAGDPAREILLAAEGARADLIVVGSRGLGSIAGTLLGSVSRDVVQHSDRPVLVAVLRAARRRAA
jgi:nucleotide-binding universal stress UspA family protein